MICFAGAAVLSLAPITRDARAAGNIESLELNSHNWEALGNSLKINKDGSYSYRVGSPNIDVKEQSGKIDQKQLEELMQLAGSADLAGLKEDYSFPPYSRSGQSYSLSIVTSARSKNVRFYLHGDETREEVPQVLIDITKKINAIINQIQKG